MPGQRRAIPIPTAIRQRTNAASDNPSVGSDPNGANLSDHKHPCVLPSRREVGRLPVTLLWSAIADRVVDRASAGGHTPQSFEGLRPSARVWP